MQAGAGGFANGVQAGQIRSTLLVRHHPPAGVMRGWHHRNGLACHVDAQRQTAGVNGGKVFQNKRRSLVCDVQVDAVCTKALHLVINRTRDNIARCQLGSAVMRGHETGAIGQQQTAPFTAHGFADQERFGLGVVEACGMKLNEFHIAHTAARSPSGGDAIPRRRVWVGGVQIHLAGAAGGQNGVRGLEGQDTIVLRVQSVKPQAARRFCAHFGRCDQVHQQMVLKQGDVGMLTDEMPK